MTNNVYKFSTPEHDYVIVPDPTLPNWLTVESVDREALEELLSTLELAGVAEGETFPNLQIGEDMYRSDPVYYIDMSTSTFSLYLTFEMLNYFGTALV
jgi:hypothetical protein